MKKTVPSSKTDKMKKKRNARLVYSERENIKRKLYAIAVDKYFSSVKDKDERFRAYSPSEERAAIERLRDDRQALENDLTEHNVFFALNYASQQAYRFSDYDELISLAMNGLRVAATTFDIDKGYRFNTWAAFYLKKFILRKFYVKKESAIENNTSIYLNSDGTDRGSDRPNMEYMYCSLNSKIEPTVGESVNSNFVNDMEKSENERHYKDFAHRIMHSIATSSLSTLDKTVFSKSFIDGCSVQTISKELGVSRSAVNNSKERVLSYINSNFSKEEIFPN